MKNIRIFIGKILSFLVVKFPIYLYRHVFVMYLFFSPTKRLSVDKLSAVGQVYHVSQGRGFIYTLSIYTHLTLHVNTNLVDKLSTQDLSGSFYFFRLRGYKTFFVLNSAEHKIYPPNKSQITYNCKFFLAKHS